MEKHGKSLHLEYPKSVERYDYWGQVCRTVNNEPVSQHQIDLIVSTILQHLAVTPDDHLLDLCCGNGALSRYFFQSVGKLTGVDFSEYLIEIANSDFASPPNFTFELGDVAEYLRTADLAPTVTKSLWYGAFSYFKEESIKEILNLLGQKFPNLQHIYIGNIADRDRAANFFYDHIDYRTLLDDTESAIGKWWSMESVEEIAGNTGWSAAKYVMPDDFYCAHYRFDVLLSRKGNAG